MLDLTGLSVDMTDYFTIATFLVGGLVAFWGIRKGLELLDNKRFQDYMDEIDYQEYMEEKGQAEADWRDLSEEEWEDIEYEEHMEERRERW